MFADHSALGQDAACDREFVETGVLQARRSGKTVFYRPNRARALFLVDQLRAYLTTCCPEAPE
ncbi:MAG: hypothetical protein PF508_00055 [Spirochaeta sp.]|jgi:hypothetical protein|nr:hypothetical protein [Spirochaeta sp.]